jgi:hypothetical protein
MSAVKRLLYPVAMDLEAGRMARCFSHRQNLSIKMSRTWRRALSANAIEPDRAGGVLHDAFGVESLAGNQRE